MLSERLAFRATGHPPRAIHTREVMSWADLVVNEICSFQMASYMRSLVFIRLGMCRFAGCRSRTQSHKLDVPLPLLPLTWFPPIILDTISAALTAFQQVQAIVNEPDPKSIRSSLF